LSSALLIKPMEVSPALIEKSFELPDGTPWWTQENDFVEEFKEDDEDPEQPNFNHDKRNAQ
jgi:hypothetical protein